MAGFASEARQKWQTVYGRFRKWAKEGLVDRILESIAAEPAGVGHVGSA
ncbi:MAG: transposase [Eubacteriaceae bacterium]|nr:transposase [Eubacteriaceae bacterium]